MPLIILDDISLKFADLPILRQANMVLEENERVCLIGRNGAGKSTLFKIITGEQPVDDGEVRHKSHLRISQLAQTLPADLEKTVHDFVVEGLAHLQALIAEYHEAARAKLDKNGLRELEDLQHRIEVEGGWHIDQRVETVLSEMELPGDKKLAELSGGWQRRVGLARALVSNPELLLLDEPTNHLDLETIDWLERRIRNHPGCVLFITHDRAFLQKLATRIVELDRTRLTSWPGDYHNFQRRKQEALEAEDIDTELFNKRLAEEEAWIRQGIKARRTRNEGRVRALYAMREEQKERELFKREPGARIHIEEPDNESGRKVIDLYQASYSYSDDKLIDQLTVKIRRGDRIGLIGNNGVGKSTLLNLMLGKLEPQSGSVKLGTNLEIGYFDQMRRELDPNKTIAEIVGDSSDYIKINGKERHVIGYLRGFLFSAKRCMTPVRAISGGERNRVILAKLFTRPTNLLVLDEPTNDLDVETLEVLEEKLMEYTGTLIVVSHDRAFLDNVVTSVLVFEDDLTVQRYVGGYNDWLRQGRNLASKDDSGGRQKATTKNNTKKTTAKPAKLSYKLQREFDQLPGRIDELEKAVEALQQETSDPAFYDQPYDSIQPVLDELRTRQQELDNAMERWVELGSQTE